MVLCGNCNLEVEDDHKKSASERIPCPNCGSIARRHDKSISAGINSYVQFRGKHKRPGIKKPLFEFIQGDDFHRKTGIWNILTRTFDRINNWYTESIVNKQTGEIIKETNEKLTDHVGHGDAKKPKQ